MSKIKGFRKGKMTCCYVSFEDGSDTGKGTIESPLKTWQRAIDIGFTNIRVKATNS